MDLVNVLQPFFDWLLYFCSIPLTLGGFNFTVGTIFVWCVIATIVICFVKGMAG